MAQGQKPFPCKCEAMILNLSAFLMQDSSNSAGGIPGLTTIFFVYAAEVWDSGDYPTKKWQNNLT